MSTMRQIVVTFRSIPLAKFKFKEPFDREDMCSSLTAGVQNSITQTAIKLGYYTSTVNGKDL